MGGERGGRRRNADGKPNLTARPKSFPELLRRGKQATAFVISRWRSREQVKVKILGEIKAATSGVSRNGSEVMHIGWIRSIGLRKP
jgi:hypothetical protein